VPALVDTPLGRLRVADQGRGAPVLVLLRAGAEAIPSTVCVALRARHRIVRVVLPSAMRTEADADALVHVTRALGLHDCGIVAGTRERDVVLAFARRLGPKPPRVAWLADASAPQPGFLARLLGRRTPPPTATDAEANALVAQLATRGAVNPGGR
jgi:hypothetical protein